MVQPLYDDGSLLGFSICDDHGVIVHNESFFSDEAAWQATAPFTRCSRQLGKAGRVVKRMTVQMEDVILIYGKLEQGHALFSLDPGCDLDAVAEVLS